LVDDIIPGRRRHFQRVSSYDRLFAVEGQTKGWRSAPRAMRVPAPPELGPSPDLQSQYQNFNDSSIEGSCLFPLDIRWLNQS
jgi:hypothetical protein